MAKKTPVFNYRTVPGIQPSRGYKKMQEQKNKKVSDADQKAGYKKQRDYYNSK